MRIKWTKQVIFGLLAAAWSIGFISFAFSPDLIRPFPLTPNSDIEKYNYVAGIVTVLKPAILLLIIYYILRLFTRLTADPRINDWLKKNTTDVRRFALAFFIYQIKELMDYLTFENVLPECFNPFWFVMLWEILPVFLLVVWALSFRLYAFSKCPPIKE